MRVLPLIANTVGQWTAQGTPADSSGNGNDLAAAHGSIVYANFDTCLQGFRLDDGTGGHSSQNSLIAPSAAVLRLTGELTMQFTFKSYHTTAQSFFACLNAGASRVLYDSFIDGAAVRLGWFDGAGARDFVPSIGWTPFTTGIHNMAIRRKQTSPGNFAIDAFIDGALLGSLTGVTPPTDGTERLTFGGFAADGFGSGYSGWIGNIRLLNVARSDADILADHNYVQRACPVALAYKGLLVNIKTKAAA